MEKSPLAFLTSLTGKGQSEAFASNKAFLTDDPAKGGERFRSFLEDLLTAEPDANAGTVNIFAPPPAPAGKPFEADGILEAVAPSDAALDNITVVAAPIEGVVAPVAAAETAAAQAAPIDTTTLAPTLPAQIRAEKPAPLSVRADAPAKQSDALLQAFAKQSGATTAPVSGAAPVVAAELPADTALLGSDLEQASSIDTAAPEKLLRQARPTTPPPGLVGNGAANASFALAENAAPDAFANAALTRGDGDLINIEGLSGRGLEALTRAEASAANVMPVRDQIVAAVAARPGENRIEVRLDPPELGKVTIAFEGDGPDIIRAVVYADTSQTLDLMRRHADVFQRALGEQGFENLDLQFAERGPRDNASDEAKEQLRSFRLADDEGPAPETPGPLQYVEGRLDRRM